MKQIPLNTDVDGNCFCLKANYYKMGGANFIGHTSDGFKATCVMEVIERDTPMKGNYKEPRICTMVGRDPNSPSSRVRSDHYEQFLEMGDDVSNTLTSVQKDKLVAEPTIHQLPHGFNKGGVHHVSPTLTGSAFQDNNLVAEPQPYIEVSPGSVFDASYPDSKTRRGRVQEGGQVSPTLMAGGEAPCRYEGKEDNSYRIRKLTPRECFRLMGVSETNIDKIQQSGVSQSQQYKMAGNSIVVDVLEHIFRKLFIETEQESQQLFLF